MLPPRKKTNLETEKLENTAVVKRRGKSQKCNTDEALINVYCVGRRCYKEIMAHREREGDFVKVRREKGGLMWYAWVRRAYV